MKVKIQNYSHLQTAQSGFTLIELLVVISIMGLIAGAVVANFTGQRNIRDLSNAQNQLVTNIRKTQSYALASHNLSNGLPAEYYLLKFDLANPTSYTIEAMYNVTSSPLLRNVETIKLPNNVSLANLDILNANGASSAPTCVLVAFQLPYAKVISNNGCAIAAAPAVASGDDYNNVLQFISNVGSAATQTDSIITVTLKSSTASIGVKKAVVNGITGLINFQ